MEKGPELCSFAQWLTFFVKKPPKSLAVQLLLGSIIYGEESLEIEEREEKEKKRRLSHDNKGFVLLHQVQEILFCHGRALPDTRY